MRYLPEYNKHTGSVKASIFFLQLMYWHEKMGGKPFFKFKNKCSHPTYKIGDSWAEELGFSVDAFNQARKQCSSKLKLHSEYLLTEQNLILFWSTGHNLTMYLPNYYKMYELSKIDTNFEKDFPLFGKWVSKLRKSGMPSSEQAFTPTAKRGNPFSYIQEKTTEEYKDNTTENILSQFNFSERFLILWSEWEAHYKTKAKKSITPAAAKKMLGLVSNYDDDFLIKIINEAIAKDWTNFYFDNTDLKYQKYLTTKNKLNETIKSKTGESFDSHVVDAIRKYS